MNLQPLFETQKKLMERIGYNKPDRFEKTILALLVEVGECANEWRGFKYWSKDQEPRNFRVLSPKYPSGGNPLLEEYVDGLHFVLQLGIEVESDNVYTVEEIRLLTHGNYGIVEQFAHVYYLVGSLGRTKGETIFNHLICNYIYLGEMLGFTWEQIEQAYMDKNKVNHERQTNGY